MPTYRWLPVVGLGVYDDFLECYELTCGAATALVYMDRVHGLHEEADPVPGYTMIEDS